MKNLLIFILCIIYIQGFSQIRYNPSKDGVVQNLPTSPAQGFPLDARSYKRDSINYTYRPFIDTVEVKNWFYIPKFRVGQFPIVVNTGGILLNGIITGGVNDLWYYKNGTADSQLVRMNSGATLLDTSRTSLQVAIKNRNGTDSAIVLQSDSNALAGIQIPAGKKKELRNEYPISYTELRLLSQPASQSFIHSKINNTFGDWYWDATSVAADDTLLTVKITSITTGRLKRFLTDYVDLRWAEGVTPNSDIAIPLQKVVTLIVKNPSYPKTLKIIGNYTCSKPIEVWNWDAVAFRYQQVTINIVGDPGSIRIGGTPNSQITATFKDAPLFSMQLNKSSSIRGLFLTGAYTVPALTVPQFYNASFSSYGDPTCIDNQHALYCAIAIDPISYDRIPADSGYLRFGRAGYYTRATGQPTITSGSTGCTVEDCYFSNFTAGVTASINGTTQNGEDMNYRNLYFTNMKVAVVSTQSEEKSNNYENIMVWSQVFRGADNRSYGGLGQAGTVNMINWQFAGLVNEAFNWNFGGSFASNFEKIFGESMGSVGFIGSGSGICGTMINSEFTFATPANRGGYYSSSHINGTSEMTFQNCKFRIYTGNELPLVVTGSPNFDHCSFQLPPYVPPIYGYSGRAYPNFKDCYTSGATVSPGFGLQKNIWGVPSSWGSAYIYGNYSLMNANEFRYGYYREYQMNGNLYRIDKPIETGKVITISGTQTFTFTTTRPGYFQIYDPITLYNSGGGTNVFAGLVTDTTGGTITVSYTPNGVVSGTYDVWISKVLKNIGFIGNITSGSKLITGVINDDFVPFVGQFFFSPSHGGYIAIQKISNDTITVTDNSSYTQVGRYFGNPAIKKIYNVFQSSPPSAVIPVGTPFKINDEIRDYSTGKLITQVCRQDGFYINATRQAVFGLRDSTMAFETLDVDSSLAFASTAKVKRLIAGIGSAVVPDATTSIKGKVQIGARINVASGVISADTTWAVPLLLPTTRTVNTNGYYLSFIGALPVRFEKLEMYNASNNVTLNFSPSGNSTYNASVQGPNAGTIVIGINHPQMINGWNGTTAGGALFIDGRGVDPFRFFTNDAAGTVYNAFNITPTGITTFYLTPIFNAHPTYSSNLQVADKKLVEDSAVNKIRSVYRKTGSDSVFAVVGTSSVFQYRDSIGVAKSQLDSAFNTLDTTFHRRIFQTTTAITTPIDTVNVTNFSADETIMIEAFVQARKTTGGSYRAKKSIQYQFVSSAMDAGDGIVAYPSDTYSTGLSTYTFTITKNVNRLIIQVTSETGIINGILEYSVKRLK